MSDNLTVRFVAKSDFDRWLPLWDGYNAFYGRSGKTALAREITEMTWARFFDGYELVHGLVAESNGALLGLTHYLFHRSTIAIEPVCYLQDLFTAEASRRKVLSGISRSRRVPAPAGRSIAAEAAGRPYALSQVRSGHQGG